MIKKSFIKIITIISLAAMLAAASSGCLKHDDSSLINIATGAAGGVWAPLGAALGKTVSGNIKGVNAVAKETGGAVENLRMLVSGKSDIGFVCDYHVAKINSGGMPDVAKAPAPMRIILGLYEQPLQIVTGSASGILSLKDLKGKRVSTGAVGSGTEEQAGYLLGALGIDPDKDIIRKKLNLDDSVRELKDGTLDAFFWSGALPSEASTEGPLSNLATDSKINMAILPIDSNTADMVMKQTPGVFHPIVIKAEEYPGMTSDIETLAVTAVLAVMDTFPNDLLKDIINAVFEHKNELLLPVWKGAANLTPEKSLSMLAPETRKYVHPAAQEVLSERETLYQVSTYSELSKGGFGGFERAGQLMNLADFGIGTFDGIEGEMVLLDRKMYQVIAPQDIVTPAEDIMIPYMTATIFDADIYKSKDIVANLEALKKELDGLIVHKDSFYAIRLEGTFKKIKLRSVPKQTEPYPSLEEVIKKQITGDYQNISGTLVGFWSPEYSGNIIFAGYHFHFISDDRSIGGHVLELESADTSGALDETRTLNMMLAPALN